MGADVQTESPASCRACTDMKDFLAQRGFKLPERLPGKAAAPSPATRKRDECPLDRAELGRRSWSLLHTMAAYYPDRPSKSEEQHMMEFMARFAQFYPCATCREHLKRDLVAHPPQTGSRHLFSQWMCQMHNRVNRRLGKPLFDCSKVGERWRTGPKDGSCG
ncbi:unnamed protein product (mitochondrion) [Plasmodiophora brassicae]|uniref:Sulfhydryl oxidase n=1 Tax=Plasmodiophora brassicae TaxID=37360 RepID=A0A3P3YAU9_PLABS|nr:unnamed protein product [Plasmodiophora brassicae]